jgi:hypothetical protein
MPDRIKINGRGARELLRSDDVRRMLTARMERVLSAAKADPHDESRAYEDGLHIEQDTTDRVAVRVVSGDYKGHILEAKCGILSRALDAAGGR